MRSRSWPAPRWWQPCAAGSRASSPSTWSPTSLRAEIAEGLRFLLAHRVLRALGGMVGVFGLVFMASVAILVLLARQELGLGSLAVMALVALPAAKTRSVEAARVRARAAAADDPA
jgi:hypothetical protein